MKKGATGGVLSIFPAWMRKHLLRLRTIFFQRRFIRLIDSIANKPFFMLLREDSMMERFFLHDGLYGSWEKESLRIWAVLSRQAKVILDIGANTGVYSLLAQNNNPAAKVIAVEPIDENFKVLSGNIRKNNFTIEAENVALSDREGKAQMYMLKNRLNYMTSVDDNRYALHPEIQGTDQIVQVEVPLISFQGLMARHQLLEVHLIKIDVEGHELTVLKAMKDELEKHKPIVLIEIIDDDGAREIQKIFDPLGYVYVAIHEDKPSEQVTRLWNNDHHNFLLCLPETISVLKSNNLL